MLPAASTSAVPASPGVAGTEQREDKVARLRADIERVDDAVVDLVSRRLALALRLGHEKEVAGLPVADPAREAEVVRRVAIRARDAGVDEEVMRHIVWCLIELSRRAQSGRRRIDRGRESG